VSQGAGTVSAVTIETRFQGLPGVAFGGYVAGLVARSLTGPGRVDFRMPAPFERRLLLVHAPDEVRLLDKDRLLASACSQTLEVTAPDFPSWDEAGEAGAAFPRDGDVSYPECFGCGPRRRPGDGLRVFVGPVADRSLVAGIWTPSVSFADSTGSVRPEFVWAALDCPGGWARRRFLGIPEAGVTAYLAADLQHPIRASQPYLVIGWPIRREGRKAWVGALISDAVGRVHVVSEALWLDRTTASET
jgi:hypothetical protein